MFVDSEILSQVSIFGAIEKDTLNRIIDQCEEIEYKSGEYIYQENDPATNIYVILAGKVRLVIHVEDEQLDLIEYGVGESIGETSFIGILQHSTTAIATEETKLLKLNREAMDRLYRHDINTFTILIMNIARELARRLHKSKSVIRSLAKISKIRSFL